MDLELAECTDFHERCDEGDGGDVTCKGELQPRGRLQPEGKPQPHKTAGRASWLT